MAENSYTDRLVEAVKRLEAVAGDPESTPGDIQAALQNARSALIRLRDSREFLADLRQLDRPGAAESVRGLVSSFNRFEEFLEWDRKLLERNGLPAALVVQLTEDVRQLRDALAKSAASISSENVLAAIDRAIAQLEPAARYASGADIDRVLLERGGQALVGATFITVNLKALPLELTLPGASVVTSALAGYTIVQDSFAERPLFKRVRAYFKKRKPGRD